ncbi:MAG: M48 family metallopeptidase [Planctomycetia bacterium]|nr:M48 family metallopeptidase [Planctomycetia bacterium]
MNETLHLEGLDFTLIRSRRRRTVGITVERDGDLTVTAPEATPLGQVEKVVCRKLFWVFAKLAEKAMLFQTPPKKEYISGEGFHYLGRSYRLLLTDNVEVNGTARLRLTGGRFVLPRRELPHAAELFTRWYTEHALVWLRQRVDQLAARIGKEPNEVRVRDLGNRWGSCTEGGVLNFHWRLIRLPPTLIEYVAAHELVHLLEPRHDEAFWGRLERVLPDYKQRKRQLAEQGAQY